MNNAIGIQLDQDRFGYNIQSRSRNTPIYSLDGTIHSSFVDYKNKQEAKEAKQRRTKLPQSYASKIRTNLKQVPAEDQIKAKLTRISSLPTEEQSIALRDFNIDAQVLMKTKTFTAFRYKNKVILTFRGTNIKNPLDILRLKNIFENTEQFNDERQNIRQVQEQFGQVDELVGFSKGGNEALMLGDELGIKATVFEPFIWKNTIDSTSSVNHTIYRTTESPVSVFAGLKQNADVYNLSARLTNEHALENFWNTAPSLEEQIKAIGDDLAENTTRHDMMRFKMNGKSFKEYIKDFSPVDIDAEGNLSNRLEVHKQMWDALENHPFSQLNESQREAYLAGKQNELNQVLNRHSNITETNEQMTGISLPSAGQLTRGFVVGAVANYTIDALDPNKKQPEELRQVEKGGLGGSATGALEASLVGDSVAVSGGVGLVAGGASAIAGYETQKGLEKALDKTNLNQDEKDVISDTTAGAVAGATFSATTILGAMAMGAEAGSVGGPAGVAVGAVVGATVGLGSWLVSKIHW